jgi:hypothetical protein
VEEQPLVAVHEKLLNSDRLPSIATAYEQHLTVTYHLLNDELNHPNLFQSASYFPIAGVLQVRLQLFLRPLPVLAANLRVPEVRSSCHHAAERSNWKMLSDWKIKVFLIFSQLTPATTISFGNIRLQAGIEFSICTIDRGIQKQFLGSH